MIAGTVDSPLDLFGGLVTDLAASDLPDGVSPDCQDVVFVPGAVKTRPGTAAIFGALAGNPTINYLKTFQQPNLTELLLALDSAGTFWGAQTVGAGLVQISATNGIASGARAKSVSAFSREYIAMNDGKFGIDIPRQYDGTNFDRVSQCGVGEGPAVADAAAGAAKNIVTIARTSNLVELVISNADYLASGIATGSKVTVAAVTDATFDGTFTVLEIDIVHVGATVTAHIYYAQVAANSTDATGTVALAGSVSAGLHKVVVMFKTRQGYIVVPSPPVTWNAAGNLRAALTAIPIGLSDVNIVARIVAFTVAGGNTFFYTSGLNGTPNMVIANNSTTSQTFDFDDTTLAAGTPIASLFNQVELGECAGFIYYASRLFAWGERNKVSNFLNMSFDGGWTSSGNDRPLGWTLDATSGAGCQRGFNGIWGGRLEIVGDGATAIRGLITQSAYLDAFGVPILNPSTAYSVRARVLAIAPLTQGTLHIHLKSVTGAFDAGLDVTAAQVNALGGKWGEFIGVLTAGISGIIPADIQIRVYVDGTPDLAAGFAVDNIEVFPTNTPYNSTQVRASAGGLPERFDAITGVLQFQTTEEITSAYILTDRSQLVANDHLYFTTHNRTFRTEDNGQEPSSWPITQVSGTIGTPAINGTDVGEDWAVTAHASGLYLNYFGSEPTKISQEIQPLWDRINWPFDYTIWVKVDTKNKRILVGVPLDAATSPNVILVLDYRGLVNSSQIIETPPIHFSSYSGKMITLGLGRKWTVWNLAANCAWFEPAASQLAIPAPAAGAMFFGNAVGNGKITRLLPETDTTYSDDGVAINSYYQTYYFLSQTQEQALQMRSHRKLFSYLTGFVEGNGSLSLVVYGDSNQFSTSLPSLNLINKDAPSAITGIARTGGLLTVTCGAGHGLTSADNCAVISNPTDVSMNGMFPIYQILSANTFTVSQMGLADSGPAPAGTVSRYLRDFELTTNILAERVSYKFGVNAVGSWFKIQKLIPSLGPDPWAPIRGGR